MTDVVTGFNTMLLFLWIYLNRKVYRTKRDNMDDLKARIREGIRQIASLICNALDEFVLEITMF